MAGVGGLGDRRGGCYVVLLGGGAKPAGGNSSRNRKGDEASWSRGPEAIGRAEWTPFWRCWVPGVGGGQRAEQPRGDVGLCPVGSQALAEHLLCGAWCWAWLREVRRCSCFHRAFCWGFCSCALLPSGFSDAGFAGCRLSLTPLCGLKCSHRQSDDFGSPLSAGLTPAPT